MTAWPEEWDDDPDYGQELQDRGDDYLLCSEAVEIMAVAPAEVATRCDSCPEPIAKGARAAGLSDGRVVHERCAQGIPLAPGVWLPLVDDAPDPAPVQLVQVSEPECCRTCGGDPQHNCGCSFEERRLLWAT